MANSLDRELYVLTKQRWDEQMREILKDDPSAYLRLIYKLHRYQMKFHKYTETPYKLFSVIYKQIQRLSKIRGVSPTETVDWLFSPFVEENFMRMLQVWEKG